MPKKTSYEGKSCNTTSSALGSKISFSPRTLQIEGNMQQVFY